MVRLKNKNITIVIFLFIYCSISAQSEPIIKGESTFYLTNSDGQDYAIYQYVNSEFGMRPFQIIVINYDSFEKVKILIPKIFSQKPKQNGTDYYVIGLHHFDKKQIKDLDLKIINSYLEQINNYRKFNNLSPANNKDFLDKNCINYLNSDKELCTVMICE